MNVSVSMLGRLSKVAAEKAAWLRSIAIVLFLLAVVTVAGFLYLKLAPCRSLSSGDTWLQGLVGPGGGLAFALVGLVIVRAHPANRIGWLCSLGGLGLAAGAYLDVHLPCALAGQIAPPGLALTAWTGYVVVPVLTVSTIFILLPLWFPTGRFLTPRWRRLTFVLLGLMGVFSLAVAVTPDFRHGNGVGLSYPLDNPLGLTWLPAWWGSVFPGTLNLLMVSAGLVAVFAVVLRLKRARGETRQQMRLFAIWIALVTVQLVVFELVLSRLAAPLVNTAWYDMILQAYSLVLLLVFVGLPLIIGLAIFKYRLYDIDIFINRTLVYGGLSLGVVAVYVLIVGALGTLFQAQGNLLFALLATGLIAVLFQPVRERLQLGVNRLMFGERDDPYAVLSRLGRQLQETASPQQTLAAITTTICQALKLPYAAIIVQTVGGGRQTVAASGKWASILEEWPLRYQGQRIGWLAVAPRAPGEEFSRREAQLLGDIAAQAGAAAQAAQLTGTLQKARETLVLAREEERRRIRRDLHDGLGPSVASQTFALDAAIELLGHDPAAAEKLLRGLKSQNQELVAEIRRLVYALRPPMLDELGLGEALAVHVQQLDSRHPIRISLTASPEALANLPAAVEVAAYRLVQEATNNVLRHAQASRCMITCSRADGRLTLRVADDGRGIAPDAVAGVGMCSMRERAEELGGTLTVAPRMPAGTTITAVLPAGDHDEQIRLALPEELPLVMEIIAEAAAWLQRKGINQWPSPPNEQWWRRAAAQIERGEVYLAFRDGKTVGTLRLTWSDRYWPDDGSACYVHKLAVRDVVHGTGMGKALLNWAAGQARARGRTHLRLDAPAENEQLRRYYEALGFSYQGEAEYLDYRGALFEKAL